jgi:hypothetical protein
MKKYATVIALLTPLLGIVGCAPTLPYKSAIQKNYSVADAKTFSSVLNCENTQVTEVRPNFAQDYCQVLAGNINLALQKEMPNIKHDENNPEIVIRTTLEEIHGGNAAARFWIGFGAGRSITTVYVKVEKNGKIIAERRITETTTMPNLATNNYANDDAILQDAPLIARKIGEFVRNPDDFEKNNVPESN